MGLMIAPPPQTFVSYKTHLTEEYHILWEGATTTYNITTQEPINSLQM